MRITEILNQGRPTLSFEVFPPRKAAAFSRIEHAAMRIADLHPDFMSITYGAGGDGGAYTTELAQDIRDKKHVEVLAHLTCVTSTRETVRGMIARYREAGIENILALRGDIPKNGNICRDYEHAYQLIEEIRAQGDFCVGAACYPEGHVESEHRKDDIRYLKQKVDAGCDFLTTQMFFDNDIYYNFLYHVRDAGIEIPVIAGVMPIVSKSSLARSVQLSGTLVPRRFHAIVDHFAGRPDAMKQAGIVYASEQIVDLLANDIPHIHVYTMNRPEIAEGIMRNVSALLR